MNDDLEKLKTGTVEHCAGYIDEQLKTITRIYGSKEIVEFRNRLLLVHQTIDMLMETMLVEALGNERGLHKEDMFWYRLKLCFDNHLIDLDLKQKLKQLNVMRNYFSHAMNNKSLPAYASLRDPEILKTWYQDVSSTYLEFMLNQWVAHGETLRRKAGNDPKKLKAVLEQLRKEERELMQE